MEPTLDPHHPDLLSFRPGALRYSTHESPLGPLLLTHRGHGLCGLYFDDHHPTPRRDDDWQRADGAFDEARRYLDAYFEGRTAKVPVLDLSAGTAFQRRVWEALRTIPLGKTTSYGALAAELDRPGAARAVGAANARNPISIVVPCHRVVGARGALTGYAGGEARKRWLLDHEERWAP